MKKILAMTLITLFSLFLSSCGSFIANDSNSVSNIYVETLDTGETKLIIEFMMDEEPLEIIIPNNLSGLKDSIKNIESTNIDGKKVLIISYNGDKENTIIDIDPSREIKDVSWKLDSITNNTLLFIEYTDGTTSEKAIPIVHSGLIGHSIKKLEDGSIEITLSFTTEDVKVTIPKAEKGDKGKGIESIIQGEDGNYHILIINYDDGTSSDPIKFLRSNGWFSSVGLPNDKNLNPLEGDFYYDTQENIIYRYYNEEGWKKIISLKDTEEYYKITFNLNNESASMPSEYDSIYYIRRGNYLGVSIPIPTCDGYIFKGWYTTTNPGVTNGAFTDLTPVFSNLELYAIWEEVK